MTEYQDVCISAIDILYYNSSKKYLLDVSYHMAGWKGVYAFMGGYHYRSFTNVS